MKLRSQALLEYILVLELALIISVIVFAMALNTAIYGARLVANRTKAVVEELEKMRTCFT